LASRLIELHTSVLLTGQRYNHEGYNAVGTVVLMKWVSAQLSNSQVVPVEIQAAFMRKKDGQLVCVCVCVCVSERERERDTYGREEKCIQSSYGETWEIEATMRR
jgi:hypothetical protein